MYLYKLRKRNIACKVLPQACFLNSMNNWIINNLS